MTEGWQRRLQLSKKIIINTANNSYSIFNKNWETFLAYLLQTKFSCKAAEIAAARSLNAQLFFVCHATYKAYYKKIPPTTIIHSTTSWPFHWHASWLTLYMQQVKVIDLCWAFYCCIESQVIGIVFHCKHNFKTFIYSKPESSIKNIKIKISSIRHKACLNPILVTNWTQTHNLFYENPPTPRPQWELAKPEISHEIEGTVQIPHP